MSETRQEYSIITLIQHPIENPKKRKTNEKITIGEEYAKQSLSADNVIVCIGNSGEFPDLSFKLMRQFRRIAE